MTLARMHQPKQATETAESVLEMDDSAWTSYSAARVFAVSATTPGLDPKRVEQYAARAVDLLRKAVEKGDQHPEDMKTETDLESLRERADFNQLLTDIEKKTPGTPKIPNR